MDRSLAGLSCLSQSVSHQSVVCATVSYFLAHSLSHLVHPLKQAPLQRQLLGSTAEQGGRQLLGITHKDNLWAHTWCGDCDEADMLAL